ncbi:MAG: hypothetical protein JZU50_04320 [Desulfobulbaceae bacterium]|nr:hypothetical protein [Desulfobulbaceae bacterium]
MAREMSAWIERAYGSAKDNGATVVCLVPARVAPCGGIDIAAKGEMCFVKGRLELWGCKNLVSQIIAANALF